MKGLLVFLARFSCRLVFVAIFYLALGVSQAEARPDLDVDVYNDSKVALQVRVIVGAATTEYGSIAAQSSLKGKKLPAPKGGVTITVQSQLPGGPVMDNFPQTVQASDSSLAIHVTGASATLLQNDADSSLQKIFEDMGPASGLPPLPADSAFQTFFQSVILWDEDNPTALPYYVQSSQLGLSVDSTKVKWGGGSPSSEDIISTSSSIGISPTVPMLVALKVSLAANSLYDIDSALTNVGDVTYPAAKTLSDLMMLLPPGEKTNICAAAKDMKTPKIGTINIMYGVNGATFSKKQASSWSTSDGAAGNPIVSGDVAYSFAKLHTELDPVAPTILNYRYSNGVDPNATLCAKPQAVSQTVTVGPSGFATMSLNREQDLLAQVKSTYKAPQTLTITRPITLSERMQRAQIQQLPVPKPVLLAILKKKHILAP